MKVLKKSSLREIVRNRGRFFAVLLIIALGVGFFTGLRALRPSIITTLSDYYSESSFYDYKLLSTLGFSDDGPELIRESDGIRDAEGALSKDVLINFNGKEIAVCVRSMPERLNKIRLIEGRLPSAEGECVADSDYFKSEDIGKILKISDSSKDSAEYAFTVKEFVIVGIAKSPLYINKDRGTTDISDGLIDAFIYSTRESFKAGYFTEIYATVISNEELYSEAYNSLISQLKPEVEAAAQEAALLRRDSMVEESRRNIRLFPSFFTPMPEAEQAGIPIPKVSSYVLTRSENPGYVAFDQDSVIVDNISVIFPAFFFMVAVLVCITTMTRTVDEQRTQFGTWKAMGYTSGQVSSKYLSHSLAQGLFGSVLGYFCGTCFLPDIFWSAYCTTYNFSKDLIYIFNPAMLALSVLVSLSCTVGVTAVCCGRTLKETTASILRPKAPKAGKRIGLEYLFFWRRLSFLRKVSLRNAILYKRRFIMMVIGISGCTALILTGFGILDSVKNVPSYQFEEVTPYDAKLTFTDYISEDESEKLGEMVSSALFLTETSSDISFGDKSKEIRITFAHGPIDKFINTGSVPYPEDGEILVSKGIANVLGLSEGDEVTVVDSSYNKTKLQVKGIFKNYIGDYAFVSAASMEKLADSNEPNGAYVFFNGTDSVSDLNSLGFISYISQNSSTREQIEKSFESLNLIVIMIVICAGALAFIVIYNLININISERIREIAMLKVLGFRTGETNSYIFREVNLLVGIGALSGLLLGKYLHYFVMAQIKPDGICFDCRINWQSYLQSFAVTLIFALIVKLYMRRKIKAINMAECLKSVE